MTLDAVDATDVVVDILTHAYHLDSKLPQTDLSSPFSAATPVDRRGCVEWTRRKKHCCATRVTCTCRRIHPIGTRRSRARVFPALYAPIIRDQSASLKIHS